MIKLNKNKTKALGLRVWWSNYIYWLPTIQTSLHLLPNSELTNLSIRNEFSAKGNNFELNIHILGLIFNISYWWNLKERYYDIRRHKKCTS